MINLDVDISFLLQTIPLNKRPLNCMHLQTKPCFHWACNEAHDNKCKTKQKSNSKDRNWPLVKWHTPESVQTKKWKVLNKYKPYGNTNQQMWSLSLWNIHHHTSKRKREFMQAQKPLCAPEFKRYATKNQCICYPDTIPWM